MKHQTARQKAEAVTAALSALRIPFSQNEYQLHEWIAAALRDGGFVVQHEVSLAPRCRIDFLIDSVGIEVKRGKPQKSALIQQCTRYLQSEKLEGLIVVLDTSISLPKEIEGKPVIVFGLNKLWGIALP